MDDLFSALLEDIPEDAQNVLPEPDTVSYYKLENHRIIYMDFDVGVDILAIQRMIIRWNIEDDDLSIKREDRTPIRLYITSYGGDVDYMWTLIDTMLASVTPIFTVNIGTAASAAALIFMAGEKRFIMQHGRVLIHEGSATMSGDSTKVLDASDSYKKTIRRMKEFILQRTKIQPAMLNRKRNNDWELDAAACLENGVCTQIIQSITDII